MRETYPSEGKEVTKPDIMVSKLGACDKKILEDFMNRLDKSKEFNMLQRGAFKKVYSEYLKGKLSADKFSAEVEKVCIQVLSKRAEKGQFNNITICALVMFEGNKYRLTLAQDLYGSYRLSQHYYLYI